MATECRQRKIEEFGRDRELANIRKGVGMVFQQFNLFPLKTVLENIALAPIRVRKRPRADAEAVAYRPALWKLS
jgi:general L-amino acid transport system ATP-binding protein